MVILVYILSKLVNTDKKRINPLLPISPPLNIPTIPTGKKCVSMWYVYCLFWYQICGHILKNMWFLSNLSDITWLKNFFVPKMNYKELLNVPENVFHIACHVFCIMARFSNKVMGKYNNKWSCTLCLAVYNITLFYYLQGPCISDTSMRISVTYQIIHFANNS